MKNKEKYIKLGLNFLDQIKNKYPNMYADSSFHYEGSTKKVILNCSIHGPYSKLPSSFLDCGCKICNRKSIEPKRNSTLDFIRDLNKIISIDNLDFTKTNYQGRHQDITITCKIHGDITKKANSFLLGNACLHCNKSSLYSSLTKEEFIIRVKEKFPTTYDLSSFEYTSATELATLRCLKHGWITKKANLFYTKNCKECALEDIKYNNSDSPEVYQNKIEKKYPNQFDYSLFNYQGSHEKVTLICKEHGEFTKKAYHVLTTGCPICNKKMSKYHRQLYLFLSSKYKVIPNYRPVWLNKKEIDLFLPDFNLGIECNGIAYHHSTLGLSLFYDATYKPIDYHLNKYNTCKDYGINLIHIFEFEAIDTWIQSLENYLSNIANYNITFKNIKRIHKTLSFYGESRIIKEKE